MAQLLLVSGDRGQSAPAGRPARHALLDGRPIRLLHSLAAGTDDDPPLAAQRGTITASYRLNARDGSILLYQTLDGPSVTRAQFYDAMQARGQNDATAFDRCLMSPDGSARVWLHPAAFDCLQANPQTTFAGPCAIESEIASPLDLERVDHPLKRSTLTVNFSLRGCDPEHTIASPTGDPDRASS